MSEREYTKEETGMDVATRLENQLAELEKQRRDGLRKQHAELSDRLRKQRDERRQREWKDESDRTKEMGRALERAMVAPSRFDQIAEDQRRTDARLDLLETASSKIQRRLDTIEERLDQLEGGLDGILAFTRSLVE